MTATETTLDQTRTTRNEAVVVIRHRISTRLWHWINVVTLVIMLMSGLMIFNAHPNLYWGQYGANFDPPGWRSAAPRAMASSASAR